MVRVCRACERVRACRRCKAADITGTHKLTKYCDPCRLLRRREQNRGYLRVSRNSEPAWGQQEGTIREVAERGRVRMLAWREEDPELAAQLDHERLRRGLSTP